MKNFKLKIHPKIKRLVISALPSGKDLSIFLKLIILLFIGATFFAIFQYTSTANAQVPDVRDDVLRSVFKGIEIQANGCMAYTDGKSNAAISNTTATSNTMTSYCEPQVSQSSTSSPTTLIQVDYGATGRLINGTAMTYDVDIAKPGTTVEYYASKVRGVTMAQDNPTSGRSTLAPVLFLNQAMVNLAYAVVVIVLIFSSLSILIGSLAGGEERFTLVQLMINAGVTLLVATFYYEIAAVIFDVCVNYGNALVASILSPYVNSYAILDRLQPGGNLNITAVVNTFQFVGVSDSLLTVVKNVTAGLYPALAQSSQAFVRSFGLEGVLPQNGFTNNVYSWTLGLGGSAASLAIGTGIASFLGNTEVFSAIMAWAIFFLNLKIFVNLLTAFLTFSITTGFGPLIVVSGVSGGFEKIQDSFKSLAAAALIFPFTFLMILLAGIATNIRINDTAQETSGNTQLLCAYSTNDPANTENSVVNAPTSAVDSVIPGNQAWLNPADQRARNYLNQRIYDTVPFSTINGVPDCRPALFPVPFTYIPAPFGNIGLRSMQVQTIDSLIRTFLGIIFIIMAARAPSIINEVLEVKEVGFMKGLTKPFTAGVSGFFGAGTTAFQMGLPITKFGLGQATKFIGNRKLFGLGTFLSGITGAIQSSRTRSRISRDFDITTVADPTDPTGKRTIDTYKEKENKTRTLGDAFGNLTQYDSKQMGAAYGAKAYQGAKGAFIGMGLPADQASLLAGQQVLANFDKITKQMTTFGNVVASATSGLEALAKALGDAAGSVQKLVAFNVIDDL